MNFFETGDLVISAAGHDKDKYFIVTGVSDTVYVWIADGKSRKLDKPKKKKVKHLKLAKKADNSFTEMNERRKLTNSALRKHIAKVSGELPDKENTAG